SVLVSLLREIGAEPIYHVPHRIEEGYGLKIEGLRRLRERGGSLVVAVDCGISNGAEIDAARDFGLDVVVVDQHQAPDELPPAVAVINPHRRGVAVFRIKGFALQDWRSIWLSACAPSCVRSVGSSPPVSPMSVVTSILLRWVRSPIWCR